MVCGWGLFAGDGYVIQLVGGSERAERSPQGPVAPKSCTNRAADPTSFGKTVLQLQTSAMMIEVTDHSYVTYDRDQLTELMQICPASSVFTREKILILVSRSYSAGKSIGLT
jgi:hypothetical protein